MKTTALILAATLALSTSYAAEKKATPPCCRVGLPPGKPSDKSIYQLSGKWTSDLGHETKLDVLRGRPVVMAMFFSNCQHSCRTIVADMKAIESKLPAAVRAKTDFMLISIDPKRDTVEALKAFRGRFKLNDEHWMLLRGANEDVAKVAEFTGFKYSSGSETQYAHSLLITVLNKKGEIVHQQSGLGTDPNPAAKTVKAEAYK